MSTGYLLIPRFALRVVSLRYPAPFVMFCPILFPKGYSDAAAARPGEVYYADTKGNEWWIRLADRTSRIPNFKVKGRRKVIELHGDWWHSEEFCKLQGLPDYYWIPERMIEEYATAGIQYLVYWEHQMRDPVRRAEIKQEIVVFAKAPRGVRGGVGLIRKP